MGYQDQYVLIGGAACDIIFEEQDTAFRATKDLDLVLIVEALTPAFGHRFWQFVRDGGYEHRAKSSGAPQFYRFDKPKAPGFPYMLELFSRAGDAFASENIGPCVPLPLGDELSSLSAILLKGTDGAFRYCRVVSYLPDSVQSESVAGPSRKESAGIPCGRKGYPQT